MDTAPNTAKGEYLHHSINGGFRYAYWCSHCKRKFISGSPEESTPILCHGCYTGGNEYNRNSRYGVRDV